MLRPRLTARPERFVADDLNFPKMGLPQCPSEKKERTALVCVRHVPSLVPVYAQSAAKPRASPPTALEFTAETDSALEEAGFEPSVPRDAANLSRPAYVRWSAPAEKSA